MSTTRGVDVSFAIKEQTSLQQAVDPQALTTGDWLGFESEGLTGGRQIVNSRTLRRSAMQRRSTVANGTVQAGGSLELQATQVNLDKILPLATHISSRDVADATDLASPAEKAQNIHRKRYTLIESGRLIPFTTFVGFLGGGDNEGNYTRRFKGMKVNTLTLNSRVNEFLNMSLDLQGVTKEILDGARTPTYPAEEIEYAYLFDGASVKIKSGNMQDLGELPVEQFEMTINHNLDTEAYRLGSVERYALDEGQTEVNGSLTMRAGADSISGAVLNDKSGLYNDRAFVERLNLEGKYAALEVNFVDLTRIITEGAVGTGSTDTEIKLAEATKSIKAGDLFELNGQRVRAKSVSTDGLTVTLTEPLSQAPDQGQDIGVPSHLRVSLPFVKIEEPDFNVRDAGTISGSVRFQGYDNFTIDHVFKLA